jgi:phosphate transport system substrate-binding protein
MKLFCAGVGAAHPDIENASRRMKASEYEDCAKNGVKEIVEIQVGIDGIAFAEALNGPNMALTPLDVYKALAANPFGKPNTAKTWKDVNPSLPAEPILVYGPPSTSGTRDALAELILEAGCKTDPAMKALKEADEKKYKATCHDVREDGAYVDAGENDNLIVQKIAQNPKAVGVFGFSFLEENPDKLKGVTMNGVMPTYATISDFSYPGARPLYIYVKKAHLGAVKGLTEYVAEWAKAWGPEGYLKAKGMVISPDDVRAKNAEVVANMTLLDPSQLK